MGYWGFCTNGVESMGNRKINTIYFIYMSKGAYFVIEDHMK